MTKKIYAWPFGRIRLKQRGHLPIVRIPQKKASPLAWTIVHPGGSVVYPLCTLFFMEVAISLLIGMIIGAGIAFFYFRSRQRLDPAIIQQITAQTISIAESKFSDSLKLGEKDLDNKKGLIDQTLVQMKQELGKVENLMQELEKDRHEKFGALATRLNEAGRVTKDLMDTTQSLRQALSGTKSRGQWGERMAEDVLRLAGFIEGVNYIKQTKQQTASSLPDFTFMLPQDLKVNMDVKFPFNNYEAYINAETEIEKEQYKAQFLKDVRARVKELKDRAYINPNENTVDYVLLFIPNEQVYCFIQEMDRSIIDEALKAKTILCSPMTLYAVLAVIRQSIDNFAMEKKSGEMLSLFGSFKEQWVRFKDQMEKVGKQLGTVNESYHELVGTRERQLERPLQKIDELRTERGIGIADPAISASINTKDYVDVTSPSLL